MRQGRDKRKAGVELLAKIILFCYKTKKIVIFYRCEWIDKNDTCAVLKMHCRRPTVPHRGVGHMAASHSTAGRPPHGGARQAPVVYFEHVVRIIFCHLVEGVIIFVILLFKKWFVYTRFNCFLSPK